MTLFSKSKSIFEIIEEHRRAVLRGEEKTLRELVSMYGKTDRYIRSKLVDLERLINQALESGEDPGSWLFTQARYKDLINQIAERVEAAPVGPGVSHSVVGPDPAHDRAYQGAVSQMSLIGLWCIASVVVGFALGCIWKRRPVIEVKCDHCEEIDG